MKNLTRREFIGFSSIASLYYLTNLPLTLAKTNDNQSKVIIDLVKAVKSNQAITLTLLYPQGSLPNLLPLTNKFSELTQINFRFIETTVDDINTKILIDTAAGTADYDIALPATFGLADLVEANALSDLTAYANQYERQINYKNSLYSLGDRYKNKFYGYQTDGDAYLMFYNQSRFFNSEDQKRYADKYGAELKIPETWQEVDRAMEFFHQPDQDKYGGCLFRIPRYMAWEWWIRFHGKGGLPFKNNMDADIASDAGISALEELIAATQYQHPSVKTNGLFENWAEFAKGHCAVNIGWGGTQKYMNSNQSKVKGKLTYTPTPEVSYFNWGWNYVVSALSKQQEIAYLFTLFATIPSNSIEAVKEDGFFDPFREEHYTDPAIQETYGKPFLKAHQQAMRTAIPDLYIQKHGNYIQALEENIALANDGDITAQQALQLTALSWDQITEQEGRRNQLNQWQFLLKQYPKS